VDKSRKKFSDVERPMIVESAIDSLFKDEGKLALDELVLKRKLTLDVIRKFKLGYCPADIEHQLNGRIITPIYDAYNELIAVSTRHLDREHWQRFWHESFDKSFFLYGLNNAIESIVKGKAAILVEGEFDVLALHSHGFDQTVGISGSAPSVHHMSQLSRYCTDFFICFDGDRGGESARNRISKLRKKYCTDDAYEMNFFNVILPDGYDPDEYINEFGAKSFRQLLINAKNAKLGFI